MTLKAHPAAELFPMMTRDELRVMAADIVANGQKHPVVLFGGLVLDGRNRVAACEIANVTPKTETLDECPSPVAYVLSANLHRRQLNDAQKAAIAVESKAMFEGEAKARREAGQKRGGKVGGRGRGNSSSPELDGSCRKPNAGRAMAQAAASVGISTATAYEMARVKDAAPEVFEAAKAGEVKSVAQAKRMAAGEPEPKRHRAGYGRTAEESEQLGKDIAKLLLEGVPASEVARTLRCSPSTVADRKRELGLTQDRSGKPVEVICETADLLQDLLGRATSTGVFGVEDVERLIALRAATSKAFNEALRSAKEGKAA